MKNILVVDDEQGGRESLKAIFSHAHKITLTGSAKEARRALADKNYDLTLLDVVMPDEDGLTFLKEIQNTYPHMPVIMVSASTAVKPVVAAIRTGALDYVTKPYDVEDIRLIVERTIERNAMRRQLEVLKTEVSREYPVHGIIGKSPAFEKVLNESKKAAESDATVLIHGESGTGKELIARLLHSASNRRDEPFVAVHCGALPESLMESELFGHEKGAFTNADKRKPGRFELAGNGTLFFDEISEMTLPTQVKLLRVLQEREYMRIGGTQVIKTNARIVAASNKNLLQAIEDKKFREDLYYRINVVPIHMPPLRERREDIERLAYYFLNFFRQSMNATATEFEPEAIELLVRYNWPGNVRELRNIIERMLVLHGSDKIIAADCLPEEFHPRITGDGVTAATLPANFQKPAGMSLEDCVNAYERELVLNALKQANGVQTRAAELLGTTRRILKYRMDKLSIQETSGVPG